MDSSLVRQGAVVRRGEQLGTVGSQGMSTGPHLHFNVIAGRKPADIYNGNVDPLKNGLRIPAGVENRAQCG
jgi:murein DD-endopeptidase MepM/ murein hydrolase activator NlpD